MNENTELGIDCAHIFRLKIWDIKYMCNKYSDTESVREIASGVLTFHCDQIEVFMVEKVLFSSLTTFIFENFFQLQFTLVFHCTFSDSFCASSLPRLELAAEEGRREAKTNRSFESSAD